MLTANQQVWFHPSVAEIAVRNGLTPEQVLFRFAIQIGILPITGTTDPEHMKQDLETVKPGAVQLSASDLDRIHSISE